jgi:NTE family protein
MDVTLALGGGGVKGFAHIGVIKALEKHGFRIRAIAGTSAGGLMGSVYAAGLRVELIESRLAGLDQGKLYNRLPGDGPSLLGVGGVVRILEELLGNCTFSQLRFPFAVTAVDLDHGEEVIIDQGRVIDAVLATIAVPGIFPPRAWDGRMLVDGGILDPVPVNLARKLAPGLPVVAVVLSPALTEWSGKRPPPRLLSSLPLLNRLYQLRLAQSFNIFLRSVDMAGCMLTELRLEKEQPEVLIRPPVGVIGLVDRVDIPELIRIGEQAAEEALPALRKATDWRHRLSYRLPWLSDFLRTPHHDA